MNDETIEALVMSSSTIDAMVAEIADLRQQVADLRFQRDGCREVIARLTVVLEAELRVASEALHPTSLYFNKEVAGGNPG